MEGLGGAAGCTVSSDGSFVLVSQFTKNNIKRYWIKGPKAGSSEDFSNSPSRLHPSSIRRIGSTGNFWIAAVQRVTNQTAVAKVDSNGEVIQRIYVPLLYNFLSEVNEFDGSLYFGSLTEQYNLKFLHTKLINIHKIMGARAPTTVLLASPLVIDYKYLNMELIYFIKRYDSSLSTTSLLPLLLLSLLWAVLSVDGSFQTLPLPILMSGPQSFAFNSTGKGFDTGVSGGTILKYTPEKGFVIFAHITKSSNSLLCYGLQEPISSEKCGRPAGIAFNEKTGDLYVADALLGLHVVSPAGGLAVKIADGVDRNPIKFLNGLDVDPTTGIVYFTSLSSHFSAYQMHLLLRLKDATGKLYKYDPSTKTVTVLMEGLGGSAGCTVSSDGSFVLVSQITKNNIKRYWIKGPKAGSFEDFSNSPSRLHPSSIRRVGSTGNFWIAAVQRVTNQTAVAKVDSNGEVIQRIYVPLLYNFLSEVNEFDGSLYFGSLTERYVGILKL
ncbi:unnamed protein product [Brassica oleracea var. botrytis]